ncbi:MAG: STT3 domain-containing protein [Campylobacteraceae bacterium]
MNFKLRLESADKTSVFYTIVLILLAFLFSVAVRLTWVHHFENNQDFRWNNELMVTTNDSYLFAEGAKDLAFCQRDNASMGAYYQQNCHQEFDLSPVDQPLSKITYILHKILPFSLETLFLYMPAVFSSLIVIPIILLSKRLHLTTMGVIAALVSSIGISYYSRSMMGYYDTDMLNIFFPLLLVWSLSLALMTKEKKYLLLTGIEIVLYRWWYPQSYSIEFAFFILVLAYVLIFERKSIFHYQLLSIMILGMAGFSDIIRLGFILIIFMFTYIKQLEKYFLYIFIGAIFLFFIAGGLDPIIAQLRGYVFRQVVTVSQGEIPLQFFSVAQTVVEAGGSMDFDSFSSRISTYPIIFIFSLVGLVWLFIKKPVFLLLTPLLGLGFLSYWGGLRFSMYAVAPIAFGTGYFIYGVSELIKKYFNKKISYAIAAIFIIISTLATLYPTIKHGYNYRAGTVFVAPEVALLDDIGKKISREDYMISWWDYGYPLRYYADIKTLIDGGKHTGDVNFPVSFMLGADQKSAANMARLDVEYTEKRFRIDRDNQNLSGLNKTIIPNNNIAWMMKDYNFTNSNDFVLSLKTDIKLPQKTRDIYFYLPYRMVDIFPTVLRFSNRDLMSGNEYRSSFWYPARSFQDSPTMLNLGNGFVLNKQTATITTGQNQSFILKRYVQVGYGAQGFQKNIQNIDPNSMYTLMHLQAYNIFLLLDEKMYNSLYVQMFFLENYDSNLFEFVSGNPYAKIFKLKI